MSALRKRWAIIKNPLADIRFIGTTGVILAVAALVTVSGFISMIKRGPIRPEEGPDVISEIAPSSQLDPTGASMPRPPRHAHAREDDASADHPRRRT